MSCQPVPRVGSTVRLVARLVDDDGTATPPPLDVSAATTKTIYLTDPNGVTTAHAATFLTDGSDGKIYYKCLPTDLDTVGIWRIQGFVAFASGDEYSSDEETFEVKASRHG